MVGGWDHHTNLHSFPPISISISSPNPRRTMTNILHTHQWLLSNSPIHPQSLYSFVNTNSSTTARETKNIYNHTKPINYNNPKRLEREYQYKTCNEPSVYSMLLLYIWSSPIKILYFINVGCRWNRKIWLVISTTWLGIKPLKLLKNKLLMPKFKWNIKTLVKNLKRRLLVLNLLLRKYNPNDISQMQNTNQQFIPLLNITNPTI